MSLVERLPKVIRPPARLARDVLQYPFKKLGKCLARCRFKYRESALATNFICSFLEDQNFEAAYQKAVRATGLDPNIRFRVHQAIWAASVARNLEGDFLELGTGRGFIMLSVLESLDWWNSSDKNMYLVDLFSPSETYPTYAESFEATRASFSKFTRVNLVKGRVPDCLGELPDKSLFSFIHIDLNAAEPEYEAMIALWPRLCRGGIILLDDYAFPNRRDQHEAANKAMRLLGQKILTLAGGQGVIVKS